MSQALNSPFLNGLSDLSDEPVDLHNLTKFADLLLEIATVIGNYHTIKQLLQPLPYFELLELLNDCNRLDIKAIRFAIYDLIYIATTPITVDLCEDLMAEYDEVCNFYNKLVTDKYIKNKNIILNINLNLYLACNNTTINGVKYFVTYHFATFLVDNRNYELAVTAFTKCIKLVLNNEFHNEDLDQNRLQCPAIRQLDGTKQWCINGKWHNNSRVNGLLQPAIIWSNGSKYWYVNGELHNDNRVDGVLQPAVICANGRKFWCVNGKLHNDDRVNGLLHPAIIRADGTKEYYINDIKIANQ